ncbi:histidine kinase [Paenibacillus sp. JSM ZJ436]|uniref:sensor histidine kinase n=1 Tax=Paenibacillus sp. JSM ZJ436 TaxID=3376190 RepID=UPI0037B32F98
MKQPFELFPHKLGLLPYVFLIYLSLPIVNLFTYEDGLKFGFGVVMLLLFLVSYRELYFGETRPGFLFWLLLQLGIIFTFSMLYGLTYLFMGFYTANFIGWYTQSRKFWSALLLLYMVELIPLIYRISQAWNPDLLFVFPFMIIMLLSPFAIRSMNSKLELKAQLDQANEQIRNLIKGEERMRIARDLHDTLGHTLSLITLKSQVIDKLAAVNPDQVREEAREIERQSRAALRQVRELVSDMRTATLAGELQEAAVLLSSAGIEMRIEGEPHFQRMPDTTHNILSLCLREAITNIVKHSQASHCRLCFQQTDRDWKMTVQDDGIGISREAASFNVREKNGLKGMAERLALVNGKMELLNAKGTLLQLSVPIVVKDPQRSEAG